MTVGLVLWLFWVGVMFIVLVAVLAVRSARRSDPRLSLPSVAELEAENRAITLLLEELEGVMYEGRIAPGSQIGRYTVLGHGEVTREWSPIKPRSVPHFLRAEFIEIRPQIPGGPDDRTTHPPAAEPHP